MFGFQRVWDFIWAASDMRVRGFLVGGTAGRTTLNGEGLQHQDGHSHLAAAATPNIKAYDLAYAYEIAIVVHQGMKEMCQEDKDVVYYLTVENENYVHPPMAKGIEDDIVKGLYKFKSANQPDIRLLGSGPLMGEVIAAGKLLENDWDVSYDIWNVTSYSELRKEAEEADRWNTLNPRKKQKRALTQNTVKPLEITTTKILTEIRGEAEGTVWARLLPVNAEISDYRKNTTILCVFLIF